MIKKVDEYQINDTKTQIVSEPVVAYRVQGESNILNNCVYVSLISILMVGAYIILSFIIIDVLN